MDKSLEKAIFDVAPELKGLISSDPEETKVDRTEELKYLLSLGKKKKNARSDRK